MSTSRISVPDYLAEQDTVFGPAMIEHRTANSGLSQLGTYFMVPTGTRLLLSISPVNWRDAQP